MYSDLRHVHLELTERCNAACPMCSRNQHGGADNPRLIGAELRLGDVKTLLPPSLLHDLADVLVCGNYGDPIVARDLLAIVDYIRSQSACRISMNTNGSLRDPAWWHDLGAVLGRPGDRIKFGIDGLADTNAIYRRHTSFEKIIENARSFIAAGGIAEWDYIVFRHNEHQVDLARAMARDLGFRQFRVKRTGRFYDTVHQTVLTHYPIMDRDGQIVATLEPSLQYTNAAISQQHQTVIANYGSFAAYLDSTTIQCKVVAESSIYISARCLVFPCCWTAQIYDDGNDDIARLLATCGIDSINGLLHSIRDIMNGAFFQRIAHGWSQSCANGRIGMCARICGAEFQQVQATSRPEEVTNVSQ